MATCDDEITNLPKEKWKRMVKKHIYIHALETLNNEHKGQSKISKLPRYQEIRTSKCINELSPIGS